MEEVAARGLLKERMREGETIRRRNREGGSGSDSSMDWMSLKEEQEMVQDWDRFEREAVVRIRHGSHIETSRFCSLCVICGVVL